MADLEPMLVKRPAGGRLIGLVGDVYRFVMTGDETDGRYTLLEATVLPGGGPPPHIHCREEETFYVLEGEITFQIGDEKSVCGPGTFVHVPIGNLHAFKNESNQAAKMLITFSPSGLERMFYENGKELKVGESPEATSAEEIERLLASAVKYGIEYKHGDN